MVRATTLNYQFLLAGYYDDFNGARVIPNDDNRPSLTDTYDHSKTHYGNSLNGEATTNTRYRWSYADRAQLGSNLVPSASEKFLKNVGPAEWLTFDVIRQKANKWEGRSQLQYPDSNTNANKYEFGQAGTDGFISFCNGHDTAGTYTVPTGDNDASQGRATRSPYTIVNYNAGSTTAQATSGSTAAAYGSNGGNFIQTTHLTGCWMGERNYDFSHFSTGGATETPELLYTPHRSPGGKPFLCIEARHLSDTGYIVSSVPRPAIAYDALLNSRQDNDTFGIRFAIQSLKGTSTSADGNAPKMVIHIGFPSGKSVDGEKGFDTNANTAAIEWNIDLGAGTVANNGLGGTYDYTNTMTSWDGSAYDESSLWIDLEFVIDYTNNRFTVYRDGTAIKNTSGTDGPFTMNNNSETSGTFLPSEMRGYQIETMPQSGDTNSIFTLMLDRVGLYQSLSERADGTLMPPIDSMQINSPINGVSSMMIRIADDPGTNTATGAVGLRDQDYTHFLNNIFRGTVNDWSLLLFYQNLNRPLWWGLLEGMNIKQGPKTRMLTLQARDPLGLLERQVPLWELGQGAENDNEQGVAYWTQESQTFNTSFYLGASPLKTLRPTVGLHKDDSYAVRTDQRTQVLSGIPIQMYNNEDAINGPNSIEDDYSGVETMGFSQVTSSGDTRVFLRGNPGYTTSSSITISGSTNHNCTNKNPQAVGTWTHDGQTFQFLDFDASDLPYVSDTNTKYVYAGKYLWNGDSVADTANASISNSYCFIFFGDPNLSIGDFFTIPENSALNHADIDNKVHKVMAIGKYNNYYQRKIQQFFYTYATRPNFTPPTITVPGFKLDLGSDSYVNLDSNNIPTDGCDLYVVMTDCPYTSNEYGTFNNAVASTTISSSLAAGSSTIALTSSSGFNSSGSDAKPATINFAPITYSFSGFASKIDFVTYTGISTNDLTGVPTSGENDVDHNHFRGTISGVARSQVVTQPGWLYGSHRGIVSTDRGFVTPLPTSVTDISTRASHAVWMRDLPKSLWFQYHFGKMVGTDELVLGATYKAGTTGASVAVGANVVTISSTLYNAIPSSGVAQLGSPLSGTSYLNSVKDQVDRMDLDTFIYRGKATSGGAYYLIGCSFISKAHDTASFIGVANMSDDYKHCWALWADMRNDGTADADGAKRKSDFGIIEPTIENYEVDLFYADQLDENGNPDVFTDLKLGQDVDVWEINAQIDPSTRGAWSKPADYSTGAAATLADASGALRLTVSSGHGVVANDYIHIFNSDVHDGVYEVASVTSTTITLGANTFISADNGHGAPGVFFCKVTGSETETNTEFHDWEDKAGSFLIVDSSKFFNLNTTVNNGRMYKSVGGRTNLGEFVSTREGFPALIDNYWKEAMATFQTVDPPYGTHPNQSRFIADVSVADNAILAGDRHITLQNGSLFPSNGVGRVIGTKEDSITTNYILWKQRVKDAFTGTVTSNSLSGSNIYRLTDSSANFAPLLDMIGNQQYPMIHNLTTGETSIVITYYSSTEIGVCKSNYTSASAPNQDLNDYPNISGWTSITNSNSYVIPEQLVSVFGTSLSNSTNVTNSSYSEIEKEIQKEFITASITATTNAISGVTSYGTTIPNIRFSMIQGTNNFESLGVTNSLGSPYSVRLMMRIRGFVESPNNGTYYESDKMRMLWNAALMKTWLPRTRLSCIHDINNVPNTSIMTIDGTTSADSQDDFGSIYDGRSKTLLGIVKGAQAASGLGRTSGVTTNFGFLCGRDGRIEFRPRYNSGFAFDRSNLMISDMKSDMGGQITHVRVYYKNGRSFADFPTPSLSDTTRWKIIEHPTIVNHREAEAIAKAEFRKSKNTRLSITAETIRSSTQTDKMISGGRFGYIADTQRTLDHKVGGGIYDPFHISLGFSPFPGMVNGMDGNLKNVVTTGDLSNRYGQAAPYTAIGTSGTPSRTAYDEHYYSYGANSTAYALQVVHVPQDMPYKSDTTNNELRVFVGLKPGQSGTDIDNAEFVLLLVDYEFSNSATSNGYTSSTVASLTATRRGESFLFVKNSGFYQLDVPSSYSSTLNSAGAKIVVSFNAEYCRALLRHRCGDPSASSDILENANGLTGVSTGYITDGNDNSIFPLGGRKYSEFGDFAYGRSEWYAPRLHVVSDINYVPGTFATYTDKALELNDETLVIQNVNWSVKGSNTEKVMLRLERDLNLGPTGFLPYISTIGINPRTGNGGNAGGPQPTPYPDTNGPGDGAGGYGGSYPGLDPLPGNNPSPGLPTGGVTPPSKSPGGNHSPSSGVNQLTNAAYGNMKGRMGLDNDVFSGQASFSILGQKKPSPLPSMMTPANSTGLDNIQPSFGAATKTDGDVTLPGIGNSDNTGDHSSGLVASATVPIDVVSSKINVSSVISCAPNSINSQNSVLNINIECLETGESISNDIVIPTGTSKKTFELIPNSLLNGASTTGNNISVKITRRPNTTEDTANFSSVKIHSIDVLFDQSAFNTQSIGREFSSFS